MRERRCIEFVTEMPPVGKVVLNQRAEPFTMMTLKQVNHLVHDDVLEALLGPLGEFGIQADGAGSRVAAPPLGLHLLHKESFHCDFEPRLPRFDQPWNSGLQQLAVPAREDRFACRLVGAWPDP